MLFCVLMVFTLLLLSRYLSNFITYRYMINILICKINQLFWTLEGGLRRALIRCTLGPGKSKEGLGFWKGGREGAMGHQEPEYSRGRRC
jgi:hypothetical protein